MSRKIYQHNHWQIGGIVQRRRSTVLLIILADQTEENLHSQWESHPPHLCYSILSLHGRPLLAILFFSLVKNGEPNILWILEVYPVFILWSNPVDTFRAAGFSTKLVNSLLKLRSHCSA